MTTPTTAAVIEREGDAGVGRQVAHHERAHAREGELRERDLPRVAGDDHQREGEDRVDERDDDRDARAALEHE
jgi:hypothetical protein